MFKYSHDGVVITRAAMAAVFGWRKLTDIVEVIAACNGCYQAGSYRVEWYA